MEQKESDKRTNTSDLKLGPNWNNLKGRIKKEFPNISNSDLQFMSRGHCPFKCVSGASKQLRKGHILVRSPKIFIN